MTFKTFINTYESDDLMEFDFINDAKGDSRFPNVKSEMQLKSHLHGRRACSEAVEAAKRLWKKYQDTQNSELIV
ncbi:MAG TPA: YozE family protein [Roseovarius sp.]